MTDKTGSIVVSEKQERIHYKKIRINKNKTRDEHRMIMERHLGRKLKRREIVHHKNGNKLDNRLRNLEVVDISEHIKLHADDIPSLNGERNGMSKLKEHQIPLIRTMVAIGVSCTEAGRVFGVDRKTIRDAATGITWGHVKFGKV